MHVQKTAHRMQSLESSRPATERKTFTSAPTGCPDKDAIIVVLMLLIVYGIISVLDSLMKYLC